MDDVRRPNVRGVAALVLCIATSAIAVRVLLYQPLFADYLPLWAAGRLVLDGHLAGVYDFVRVSNMQGWPLGPGMVRPFVYPPTALLVLAPLSALPPAVGYLLCLGLAAPLLVLAGRRVGAPWWLLLAPWVVFSVFCGQITMLLSGLLLLGLSTSEGRPILTGLLFGIAAAIKPQLFLLLPLALAAAGRWRVVLATAATGGVLCGLSALVWGLAPWADWLAALPRFTELIATEPRLNHVAITPTAALIHFGLDTRWALLAILPACITVWLAFRRPLPFEDRLIVLLGATFLVSPYALHYDLALFAPAVAIYLSRTQDRAWFGYLAAVGLMAVFLSPPLLNLLVVLSLPLMRYVIPSFRQTPMTIAS